MKREILVKVIVDWDNYDDFSDEQILEDTGIYEWLKEGVDITIEKKQPASGSLSKKIPTVQELREAAKDYPDTFLNGALYVVDKYLDAKQPVSGTKLNNICNNCGFVKGTRDYITSGCEHENGFHSIT